MKTFELMLFDTTHCEKISGVRSFVGEDATGSFGIQANHCRMMTALVMGLARYRTEEINWQYLAMPGAILYFKDNTLTLYTRHYLRDEDYLRISAALQDQLLAEEKQLHAMRDNLRQMEETLLKRLWELGRQGSL